MSNYFHYRGFRKGRIYGHFYNLFIMDVVKYLSYASVLLFADDVKIFIFVVERLKKWCKVNKMVHNPNKCKYIHSARSNTTQVNTYRLCGERINLIFDLGVFLYEMILLIRAFSDNFQQSVKHLGF